MLPDVVHAPAAAREETALLHQALLPPGEPAEQEFAPWHVARGTGACYAFRRLEGMRMSHTLEIAYGDDVLLSSGLTREAFDREARFLLAAKLYELGRLSSGQAAGLCGKGRVDFLLSLPDVGVSVSNLRPEDVESEVDFIEHG